MPVTYKTVSGLDDQVTIIRVNDDGSESSIPDVPGNSDYQAYLAWVANQNNGQEPVPIVPPDDPAMVVLDVVRDAVSSGMETNRQVSDTMAAIQQAATAIEAGTAISAYDVNSPVSAPVVGATAAALSAVVLDLVNAVKLLDRQVKDLAHGFDLVANAVVVAAEQRNYLARLAVGDLTGTD